LYDQKASKLRQERHISPLTGLEIFVGSLSTKIPLLTELEFSGTARGKRETASAGECPSVLGDSEFFFKIDDFFDLHQKPPVNFG
jgi:hypothetical protein